MAFPIAARALPRRWTRCGWSATWLYGHQSSALPRLQPGRRYRHSAATEHIVHTQSDSHPIAASTRDRARARIAAVDATNPWPALPALTDRFQRTHTYLRISLTERCNLRCTYCMPEEGVPLTPNDQLLQTEEILYLARVFVAQGVTKIRLTGGEPTIRKDFAAIVGLQSISVTTNGIALKRKLPHLVANGLDGINLSLDTLDPFKFQLITRRKGMERVLECLDQALTFTPDVTTKINCVVTGGVNDDEVGDFVELTRARPVHIRFIEYMPFDGNRWKKTKLVPSRELLKRIESRFGPVDKLTDAPNDTSRSYRVPGYLGQFGFISSMTDHFCSTCNRIRLTADGNLKVCLFGNAEVSLRDFVRSRMASELNVLQQCNGNLDQLQKVLSLSTDSCAPQQTELLQVIQAAIDKKKQRHAGMFEIAKMRNRPMVLIGG
ncbi:hypothetical protein H4R34_000099 [Dimargaris verticillata]|uniref:GTP 3',8-cyclase n=1 Tax=Dimargaris verticillata TaxID=2761393 RepID=A0A9W8BE04_9FUNG|nr:hypothetical protein H4R34_000099 [Dimargaris verticillata]